MSKARSISFGSWLRGGGGPVVAFLGLQLGLVVAGRVGAWYAAPLIWIGVTLGWIRATLAVRGVPKMSRVTWFATAASGYCVLVFGLGGIAELFHLDPLLRWVWPAKSLAAIPWIGCLLLWPMMRRSKANWQYLVLDLGIVALAAGLTVWYYWFRGGPGGRVATSELVVVVGSSLVFLLGANAASVRHPVPDHRIGFRLLLFFVVAQYAVVVGLSIINPPPYLIETISRVMVGLLGVAALLAPEAIRAGWRGEGGSGADGASPVPWVAVMAIGFFVMNVVFQDGGADSGPIVLGAMAAMVLLAIRQGVTMRHNVLLQAERSALEADARIAALVRHTSDIILIADDHLRIRFASPSAEALWAGETDRLIGTQVQDLVDPSQRADVERVVAARLAQPGQSDVARWRMQGPQGDWRRIEAVVTSLLHQPSVNGIVLTLRDQTERALLEEQLSQAQKMEAIGQLAGGVAHDFNNLLTTMLGHSEVGLDILEPDHPARDDFAQIKKAAELAASLTKQLLAFSRKQVVERIVIDVTSSLDQVVKLLRRLIKEDVTTVLEVAPEVGYVRMDPSQLEQVVLNLAVNARDAMPDGGRLTIRARPQRVTMEIVEAVLPVARGEYLVIEVSDTGVGMDRPTQQRIFEPFFTTKPVGRGTGLGLASVYGIVKQNEGGLVLTSAPGTGTCFAVYLPRVDARPEEMAPGQATRRDRSTSGETILLVEDQVALREIAERVLLREGYRVLVAADGDEALMLAAGAPYPIDLVLTDVIMPGLSGPKMVAEMRRRKDVPRVLYVSGYPGDDLLNELGVGDRLLKKPFTPYVLIEQVRAALEGRIDTPVSRE